MIIVNTATRGIVDAIYKDMPASCKTCPANQGCYVSLHNPNCEDFDQELKESIRIK